MSTGRKIRVVVANSGFYGAGMHIVPTAEVDDGLLDVLVIPDSSRWTLIAAIDGLGHGPEAAAAARAARDVIAGYVDEPLEGLLRREGRLELAEACLVKAPSHSRQQPKQSATPP